MADYNAFGEYVRSKDASSGGEALEPTATGDDGPRPRRPDDSPPTGRSPRRRRPSAATTWSSAKDLDEAIELAARIPGAQNGSIEVRPIWEIPDDILAGGPPRQLTDR